MRNDVKIDEGMEMTKTGKTKCKVFFFYLAANYATYLYIYIRLQSAALGNGAVLHSCENNNKTPCFIKICEFVDELKDYYILKYFMELVNVNNNNNYY
jgi:hypothetical protein